MTVRRGWAVVVHVLVLVLALSACSTVPSTSPTMQITQMPTRAADEVGIEPLPPEPGATPEEVVRSFIDAAASTRQGHRVAAEHLTPEAQGTWNDESGITVISPGYATVTTAAGSVRVTGNRVGTVDPRGVFTVAGPGVFTRDFALEQVEEEWRISDPPDGLIILEPDFVRLYDRLSAFFLDPTDQRLVPDPRHLVVGEAQPTALVQRLLDGPSPALAAGVRNPLTGVQLERAVTVEGNSAVVDLTGISPDPSTRLSQVAAQLVWTLDQLDSPRINSVEIRIDGEPVDIEGVPDRQTVEDWPNVDPESVPVDAVGHYISGGALHTVTRGEPAPGPAGSGAYALSSAAVASDPRSGELAFLAGVRATPSGATLFAGRYAGELAPVLAGGSLSAPTVAATRMEAWVVRDGTSIVRVQFGGDPQGVSAPTLPRLGPAEALELSPDGVRAALVVQGPGGPTLYVGTVVRSENGGVALPDLRQIAPDLSRVVDVAWRDGGTLLVLAGDAGDDRIVPYELGVDGWGLTDVPTAGLPSQPTSIGAAPTRQPLVNAGSTIWQLAGGTWVTLVRGREPLPGTAPFYPL
ncbi:LpqB family beta-propeller domain-containing protein [Blastococcus sp. PRF04-17]|uniref:LpqB family beta-propeller domain-containing protein n=1 Tax=Blastococcus sp. PRF04-17 TaxID=2933797 RepID=UPI001FF19D3B|nr:LpqB family beta-propeller domain-containing protein [Blastococcus sp. PRF04-17]UOY01256.1 LpqB family beta-propeller domain-containing protein [Blastococcus sp. PRF04-17]